MLWPILSLDHQWALIICLIPVVINSPVNVFKLQSQFILNLTDQYFNNLLHVGMIIDALLYTTSHLWLNLSLLFNVLQLFE